MKYQVWDKINAEQDDAVTIEAFSPSDAAEKYAKWDRDGSYDGIYIRGHSIMVYDGNSVVEFEVTYEALPSFHATRVGAKGSR